MDRKVRLNMIEWLECLFLLFVKIWSQYLFISLTLNVWIKVKTQFPREKQKQNGKTTKINSTNGFLRSAIARTSHFYKYDMIFFFNQRLDFVNDLGPDGTFSVFQIKNFISEPKEALTTSSLLTAHIFLFFYCWYSVIFSHFSEIIKQWRKYI